MFERIKKKRQYKKRLKKVEYCIDKQKIAMDSYNDMESISSYRDMFNVLSQLETERKNLVKLINDNTLFESRKIHIL